MSISSSIKSIQDIMRKDVGVDGDAQRIGQLVWLLFLKIFDDREQEWELLDDAYRSPLPEPYRWRTWAANPEGVTGDELKSFIDNELFPSLQKLESYSTTPAAFVVRSVFEDAYNYMKSGHLLRQVVNKIQEAVDFNKAQERHAFGDMYEQLLRDLQSAGNAGEFYTPRPVTEFMVRMVDPKLHEKVMDPACGTGGFLTCTIEHKRRHYVKTPEDERVLQASIGGVEKKPLPHLLATTNMILHGIEVPSNIRHDNTLARPLISWGPKYRVDCIVANPPFGGMEEDGIEINFPQAFRTRETADLFLVLIMHLLKDGGRAAVVLPDGFLFGEGIKSRIKEKLLADCNLHTIVRLPNGVFNPYTGIKTNLLFFTKGTPTKDIWFYEHQYPAGVKNYSKTRPMRIEEFAVEQAWWGSEADDFAARGENEFAWKVSVEDIKARNYNLDCKNPHVGEQVSHDPAALLAEYARMQEGIHGLREQLKAALAEALERDAWQQLAEHFHALFTTEASIDALKQTVLQLAVTGRLLPPEAPFLDGRGESIGTIPLPRHWQVTAFNDLVDQNFPIGYGVLVPGPEDADGVPFVRIADLSLNAPPQLPEKKISREVDAKFSRTRLVGGEILMGVVGSIGKLGIAPPSWAGANIARAICRIVPAPTVCREFVLWLLQSDLMRNQFIGDTRTLAQPTLNVGLIRAARTPLPPLEDQQRIVAVIDRLMALCDELQRSLVNANEHHENLASVLVAQAVA